MQEARPRRLGERTVDYGLAAMDFCGTLPRTAAGRHIADQLLRSATSVAANYAEASEAESTADFVHKMKLAMKELKESRVWLLFASRLAPGEAVESLRAESRELLLMAGKSINTASARMQGKKTVGRVRWGVPGGAAMRLTRHDNSDWLLRCWLLVAETLPTH